MNNHTATRRRARFGRSMPTLACALLLGLPGAAFGAQQGADVREPGAQRPQPAERAERVERERRAHAEAREPSAEVMRERLTARLEQIDAERARIATAINLIDEGAPVQDVMRALRPEGEAPRVRPGQPAPGPHGRPGVGRHAHDANAPMPPHVRERMMETMRERNPDLHRRMTEMRRNRPEAADRFENFLAPRMQELSELSERDPALFEIRMNAMRNDLASLDAARRVIELRQAGTVGAEMDTARSELTSLVSQRFDLRMQERAHQAEQLARRLEQARNEPAVDDARREQLINRMAEELIRRVERERRADKAAE